MDKSSAHSCILAYPMQLHTYSSAPFCETTFKTCEGSLSKEAVFSEGEFNTGHAYIHTCTCIRTVCMYLHVRVYVRMSICDQPSQFFNGMVFHVGDILIGFSRSTAVLY